MEEIKKYSVDEIETKMFDFLVNVNSNDIFFALNLSNFAAFYTYLSGHDVNTENLNKFGQDFINEFKDYTCGGKA